MAMPVNLASLAFIDFMLQQGLSQAVCGPTFCIGLCAQVTGQPFDGGNLT